MKLEFEVYKDKVMGCWAGKNIGGILGAPFEALRQWNEVEYYVQDLSKGPPPNDDLDLQIIWLAAVEKFGRQVDASILGEYWLSYVIPNWVEYGTGKANMIQGLRPPVSGNFLNQYKDSCGCFIRSEIWACLAPGRPEIAVLYAYEDGIVDHSGEGIYGEVFFAAMESAAFVESDVRKLIDIGLSYIPADSAVAGCINKAVECYDNKVEPKEARIKIHNEAPGTFGLNRKKITEEQTEGGRMEVGTPGFDCPENVGFTIMGLLYGEGDFGKSIVIANACGEDTDCTAATLGAIMGIILGASRLPEKWTAPVENKIVTLCIDKTSGFKVPETVTELTDRVLRATPLFLGAEICDLFAEGGYTIDCLEDLYCQEDNYMPNHAYSPYPRGLSPRELVNLSPNVVRYTFPTHWVMLDYGDNIYFRSEENRKIKITIINNNIMCQQMWCSIRIYTPENVYTIGGSEFSLQLNTLNGQKGETVFEIDISDFTDGKLELLFDISFAGRHTSTQAKAILLRTGQYC